MAELQTDCTRPSDGDQRGAHITAAPVAAADIPPGERRRRDRRMSRDSPGMCHQRAGVTFT